MEGIEMEWREVQRRGADFNKMYHEKVDMLINKIKTDDNKSLCEDLETLIKDYSYKTLSTAINYQSDRWYKASLKERVLYDIEKKEKDLVKKKKEIEHLRENHKEVLEGKYDHIREKRKHLDEEYFNYKKKIWERLNEPKEKQDG